MRNKILLSQSFYQFFFLRQMALRFEPTKQMTTIADDRGVRDRERQAALTHFSSSQAAEMSVASTTSVSVKSTTTTSAKGQTSGQSTSMTSAGTSNSSRSRQEMMAKLMKGPSGMDMNHGFIVWKPCSICVLSA